MRLHETCLAAVLLLAGSALAGAPPVVVRVWPAEVFEVEAIESILGKMQKAEDDAKEARARLESLQHRFNDGIAVIRSREHVAADHRLKYDRAAKAFIEEQEDSPPPR